MAVDLQQMEAALQAAANAGDVAAAKSIAVEMRRMIQRVNPQAGLPKDPRIEGARMAAKGMGTGEAMAVGAGRATDRLMAGLEQLRAAADTRPGVAALRPPQLVEQDKARLGQLASEQAEKDLTYSAGVGREAPFAAGIAQGLPYMAVPGSMGVLRGAATVGGLEGAQYGQPSERVTRGLLGAGTAALGGYAGKALGGAIAPTRPGVITGTQAEALRAAENLGINPRLSQVTGNPSLARMEDMAARTPGGAGIMDDFAKANQQSINRAAARTIGEDASELTPSVFAAASDRLGRVFESIKSLPGRPIQLTKQVGVVADDILRQQGKMIAQQQDENLTNLAMQAKALSANKGRIDGESYQLLRSGLSEASFDASGTNRVLYGKLLESIDDAADFSLRNAGQKDLAEALKLSRPQYGNLKTLEKGLVSEGGDVSPARLAQVLRKKNPGAFREGKGKGELFDIARYGESFKPLSQGSQTYERQVSSDLLGMLLKAPLAYGAAKASTSPLLTRYPSFLATNPQAALLAQQGGLLASPVTRGATMGLLSPYFQN